jgi:undecaprenyl-diphosphatase
MSTWVVVLLGIIEGITEFLPISSTGHLLLAEHALNLPSQPSDLFNVVIQSGAVLAVLLAFSQRLRQFWVDRRTPAVRDYLAKLLLAFVITAIGGFLLKKLGLKLPETSHPVAWATLIGGLIILLLEWNRPNRAAGGATISWQVAVLVGLAQLLAAAFPGTSRSGASIMMAIAIGVGRPAATEFSFLLGVPTLLAASGYSLLSALRKGTELQEPVGQLILGTAVAAVTAFIAVRWLLRYVQSHTFIPFGWYRIALGILILVFAR